MTTSKRLERLATIGSGDDLPQLEALDPAACPEVRRQVARSLEMSPSGKPSDLAFALRARTTWLPGIVATAEDFSLLDLTRHLGIEADVVYVNFGHFDDVDKLRLEELSRRFHDIWFEGPDDIEIFDDTYRWYLSVSDFGAVGIYKVVE
jgi:hypothetical protein